MTQLTDYRAIEHEVHEDGDAVSILLPSGEQRDVPLHVGEYRCTRELLEGWPWKSGQIMYWNTTRTDHYCRVFWDFSVFVTEHGWGDWQSTVKPAYHVVHDREEFDSPGDAITRAIELMRKHDDQDS